MTNPDDEPGNNIQITLGAPPEPVVSSNSDADDSERRQLDWLSNVYQGDKVPQLTVRAVVMGAILGSLMSISNLYTMLKLGWGFGVAITACVLSFVIWNGVTLIFRRVTPMSILENNCMQSTASAAGYSTGATVATAFGALLLITGKHSPWQIVMIWTFCTAALGVLLAVPMKRQMINHEELPFPSGLAAAETLKSLYGKTQAAVHQAYGLVSALTVGAVIGLVRSGDYAWQKLTQPNLKLPELLPFNLKMGAHDMAQFPGFGFEPSVLLLGAGMIVGMRVSFSMLLGSLLLYLVVGPSMVDAGQITEPAKLLKWSLWTGTALMVTSGLTAFAVQWRTIGRALSGLAAKQSPGASQLDAIEVPLKWFILGIVPVSMVMALVEYVAFQISIPLGLLTVVMSFFLALVAARSTGETDITPIGAMGKITQLTYAVLAPTNITTNLMAASVTANTAIASADLLTDLKSGYILGANPRKQFIAQCIGIVFGTLAIVPAWYAMVPDKAALEAFNPPSTNMWRAVAEALSQGLSAIPESAQIGLVIGGVLGIVLALIEHFFPKARKFLPSAMGLGLSWVMPFQNALPFFLGALVATIWEKLNKKSADVLVIPVASGAIAGESLACAAVAIVAAAGALAR